MFSSLINETQKDWHRFLNKALNQMDSNYLQNLEKNTNWLPGLNKMFAAFHIPLSKVRYILLGESPYPRLQSANGYAFWDDAVSELWSSSGFSKPVNRATSLRNWLKALLVARGDLKEDLSQNAIAKLKKSNYCQTAEEFFNGLGEKGFLLLNASLVYEEGKVAYHAKYWKLFMQSLLDQLAEYNPNLMLLLFGNIAKAIYRPSSLPCLIAEHPYNLSFIHNSHVLEFFKPLDLLNCHA